MTAAERFKAAHLRGMAASPFTGAVTLLLDGEEYDFAGCLVKSGDNKAEAEEWGLEHQRTLQVQLPKLCRGVEVLPRRPDVSKDALRYQGRDYSLASVSGDDDCSPVWVIDATAPL